jgi:teichuronic acid biosynthesis glycosyltransferase TuaC
LNAVFLFLQVWRPIRALRRDFPFQILDAHFGHPEGVAAALLGKALGCQFTITMRGSEQMHGQYRLRRLWMSWALRRAARVICVSERLRKLAIEWGVEPSRSTVIPNGIDADVFHPQDRERCRAEYAIAQGARVIVSVGQLIALKGHHRIIRAVRALIDGGLDVELLIAGGRGRAEDYEAELRREINDLGLSTRVRLVGHLPPDSLSRLINAADVFCLASDREGWPNVLHESLACGTPVVATDVGAVPEMIPSEQYGIVVRRNDPGALVAALQTALSRDWNRSEIAAWGQSRSWGQVAAEVLREMTAVGDEFAGRR